MATDYAAAAAAQAQSGAAAQAAAQAGAVNATRNASGQTVYVDANGQIVGWADPNGAFTARAPASGAYNTSDNQVPNYDDIARAQANEALGKTPAGDGGSVDAAGNAIAGAVQDAGKDVYGYYDGLINKYESLLGLGGSGSADQTAALADIKAQLARSATLADQLGQQYGNYQPVAAPTIANPAAIQAAVAKAGTPIQAGTATAQQAQAAQISQTVQAQQQQGIQAQQVQQQNPLTPGMVSAPTLGPAAMAAAAPVSSTTLGPVATAGTTALSPAQLAQAAQIDQANQAQVRGQQQGLATSLQDTIAGKNPSVAAIMLQKATDRNIANQYAMAQAATGMNTGMAQRTAMINSAELNQDQIMQQALLRAQEIATAQGQLGGVLDTTRGADIGVATNAAGLQQQTNLANAGATNTQSLTQGQMNQAVNLANVGATNTATQTQAQIAAAEAAQRAQLGTNVSLTNAGATNTQNTTQAQLAQAAQIANQSTGLQAQTTTAQLAQAAQLANQQANLQAGTTNASLAQQVAIANAAAGNTTNQTNAANQQAANLANAQAGTQAAISNAGNVTSANTASAQLANAVNLANANNQSQANLTTGQLQAQAGIANAQNTVSTNALNQKATSDLANQTINAQGQAVQGSGTEATAAAAFADANAKKQAAGLAALGTAGAALLSDRRAKTDVRRNVEAEIAEFTAKLEPYAFRYKKPEQTGAATGQRFGIMAQDLERSRVGRTLVRERDDGTKEIDSPQAVGAILATLSAMNKRLDRVERA